ncbi:MAG: nuclear transport factor 2 family protein [Kordiimonadaceae bacterium]|nr:nuclear transport factor 2 family protein [Kordiimonadaceae bacterium]
MKTIIIVLLVIFATPARAEKSDEHAIKQIIENIEIGWETGNGNIFRRHFLDVQNNRYIKSGKQNIGLDDLIFNHLEPETDVLYSLNVDYYDVEVNFEYEFAWAIATTRVQGVIQDSGKTFSKFGFQTFLFRQINESWKIVHTHYSSSDFPSHLLMPKIVE